MAVIRAVSHLLLLPREVLIPTMETKLTLKTKILQECCPLALLVFTLDLANETAKQSLLLMGTGLRWIHGVRKEHLGQV